MFGLSMDGLVVGCIVLFAATFIGRRILRSVKSARSTKAGCASDCGCGPGTTSGGSDWSKS